ncbi:MAG: hypothetical protein ICV59_01105 [Thermoleophilia bacterium]|nr:hypothetical protein [Thermoleophilia bacterium]
MRRRAPFGDVVGRQLDLFADEHADLVRDTAEAERAYDRAHRDDAEERYADYSDLVETGTELLAELRDAYAASLAPEQAETYEAAFNRAVAQRFPAFALEIRDT